MLFWTKNRPMILLNTRTYLSHTKTRLIRVTSFFIQFPFVSLVSGIIENFSIETIVVSIEFVGIIGIKCNHQLGFECLSIGGTIIGLYITQLTTYRNTSSRGLFVKSSPHWPYNRLLSLCKLSLYSVSLVRPKPIAITLFLPKKKLKVLINDK